VIPRAESLVPSADLLVGIDDTDDLEARGTGYLAQVLMTRLRDLGLGTPVGATRHQLLVDPRIPYTSHNTSACIAWRTAAPSDRAAIAAECARFLETETAPGADPGLAMVARFALDAAGREALAAFGRRAKAEVLARGDATDLAARFGVHLSGHGGTNDGVIGALAGVGLHLSGRDGLFLWMDGIRGLYGRHTAAELLALAPIDDVRDSTGAQPGPDELIELGSWVRPILDGGRAVLLVERVEDPAGGEPAWRTAPREIVKRH
jgi:hypothetical protein